MISNGQQLVGDFASQCDWVGLREYRELTDRLSARNGQAEQTYSNLSHGIMVEVLFAGQFAYAGTVDRSTAGIKQAFDKALLLAKTCGAHKLFDFDDSVRPPHSGRYSTPLAQPLDSLSFAQIQAGLISTTRHQQVSKDIIDSWALAWLTHTDIHFVSSNGADWQQTFSVVVKDFGVTARQGNETQSRSYGFNGLQTGLEDFDADVLQPEAVRIGEQALELLEAEDCPSDTRDIILTPDQLYLQVHESIGHPLELDRILGDERNYAGWSFVSPDDFGQLQYGSNIMNVSFDPQTPTAMASYSFDDTGVQAQKAYLIKDGILVRGIGSAESQRRSDLPGVASARACDWNRAPIDRMANINLEPGDASLQQMVSATEKGILMQSNRSWSIDDYRNKFQFGCEYAQLIEDGEVTRTVKNPNYRGVTTPFWNSLKMVGDASTSQVYGSPFCGKGEPNQIIRVGHHTPTCLFTAVEIFGGA